MKETDAPRLAQRISAALTAIILAFSLALPLGGCSPTASSTAADAPNAASTSVEQSQGNANSAAESARVTIADIPAYTGALCINVNAGVPGFTEEDESRGAFMQFSDLDFEGRCGTAFARIGTDTVSNDKRGDISSVHPSGWVQKKYSFVDDGMLYNRSHLIAHQLCGENANEKNLITGTRTFNVVGMLYYEELVGDYVRATGNHVLYRVTPLFAANNLVARGVQMEAKSIEDNGEAVQFNVFVYNVEPGVAIDYVTGENWESADTPAVTSKGEATITTAAAARSAAAGENNAPSSANTNATTSNQSADQQEYILNAKNKKFHLPSCSAANDISPTNKQDYTGTRNDLIARGYTPCGICKP